RAGRAPGAGAGGRGDLRRGRQGGRGGGTGPPVGGDGRDLPAVPELPEADRPADPRRRAGAPAARRGLTPQRARRPKRIPGGSGGGGVPGFSGQARSMPTTNPATWAT